jgi:uncharacterized cupin superfamily protein
MSEIAEPAIAANAAVFDLRAWAAEAPAAVSQSWRSRREPLPIADPEVSVEAFGLGAGSGYIFPGQSADEFIHVLEGELVLGASGVALTLEAGASAVIPADVAFEWSSAAPVRLLAMRHAGGASGAGLVRLDPSLPRTPSNPPAAEVLLSETPRCRNLTQFRSADQTFTAGVWDSTPYTRRAIDYAHAELMHLLDGEVTFEDERGGAWTFRKGDLLLVRRGARLAWRSLVDVTKVFAIYRPV